jgi:multidrug resistance protein, MATE family
LNPSSFFEKSYKFLANLPPVWYNNPTMNSKSIFLSDFKSTGLLALPIILGQLGHVLIGFTDTVMVGKLGVTALASIAFGNNVYSILLVVSLGLAAALAPMVAAKCGAKEDLQAGVIFRQAFVLFTLFGLLLSLAFYFFLPYLSVFNQEPDVTRGAYDYLFIMSFTFPFLLAYNSYKQFLEGLENSVPPMIALFTAIIANVILNWVLIFGHWGFPRLEVQGAAVASLVSRIVALLILIFWTHLNNKYAKYQLSLAKFKIHFSVWKKILRLGVPSAAQYFFEVGAFSFAGIMIGWIGKEQLAAHQITLNLATFSFMVALGWGFGSSIKIGNALGKNDYIRLKLIGQNSLISILIFMMFSGVTFISFRNQFPLLYISNSEVIKFAAQFLTVAAAFQLFDGTQATALGLLRGIQDTLIPTFITFSAYWLTAIPIGYYLTFKANFGAVGVWYGLMVGLALSSVLLSLRFKNLSNKLISNEQRV